jgi:hypothetical protein
MMCERCSISWETGAKARLNSGSCTWLAPSRTCRPRQINVQLPHLFGASFVRKGSYNQVIPADAPSYAKIR